MVVFSASGSDGFCSARATWPLLSVAHMRQSFALTDFMALCIFPRYIRLLAASNPIRGAYELIINRFFGLVSEVLILIYISRAFIFLYLSEISQYVSANDN